MTLVWLGGALWLWNDRAATVRVAHEELARMSLSAAEHAHRLLSLCDLFLASIEPIATRTEPEPGDLDLIARLNTLVGQDTALLGLAMVDHQGMLNNIDPSRSNKPVFVGDRAFVTEARVGRIIVAPPVKSRISGRWVLPLVRQVADSQSPVAVLMAAIDVAALERHYDTIRHSVGGAITLMRDDGTVLIRSPSPPDSERVRTLTDAPLFSNANAQGVDEGQFDGLSPFDGIDRLGSFKRIRSFNIGVSVSLTRDAVLEPWWRRVWLVLTGAVLISLAIAIAATLILRHLASLRAEAVTLENRVEDRTRALKQLLDRRQQFLAGVSHELRSPLNAILGFSDALLLGIRGPVPPEQTEYLKDIHRSGQHLLSLVNDLLDSAAIDAGSLQLDQTTFPATEIVGETTRLIAHAATQRGIDIATRIEPPDLTLFGDRRRLLQAVLNLSVNAVKYGREGGKVEISVALDPTGGCLIGIADDGAGISAENLRLALAPYGRVAPHGASGAGYPNEGTGLGLPLSIGIVELHGGALTLHSEPGRGTRATIRLPPNRVRTGPSRAGGMADAGPSIPAGINLPVQAR
ncbi:sensor histidine kinase [Magnetospirillum fulvum]|uniref:sensor histidine kinase n=1 Tax=Magnetospirillum fulvum TaxID=1082 RepID=UPI001FCDE571|nr:ATP-binding protein [Magnetospirillum fulvum]